MRGALLAALVGCSLGTGGCGLPEGAATGTSLQVTDLLGGGAVEGFARAAEPREFRFPTDHGPHPAFRNEWWYFTGNLETGQGRRFGFQLTFFRSALSPPSEVPERTSAWAAGDVWMAHFAVTDEASGRLVAFERFRRGALGLAGAKVFDNGTWRVGLDRWSAEGTLDGEGAALHLQAGGGEGGGQAAIALTLSPTRPRVLQGEEGLSRKGTEPGNASYYYSYTRLAAQGTVEIGHGEGAERFAVTGSAWLDREWSTSALEEGLVGWDWFALQLDEGPAGQGRDLMLYRLRREDGSASRWSEGVLVEADGTSRRLGPEDVELNSTETWESPDGLARYPIGWTLQVPSEELDLRVRALVPNQELLLTVRYWEGAVRVEGTAGGKPVSGRGYLEMTGYGAGGALFRGPS